MWELINQIDDENEDFTVSLTDTDGVRGSYEFLDIVSLEEKSYAVLCDSEAEGYVDIFRIIQSEAGEAYERVTDEELLDRLFEIFRIKNEDEFDFI